MVALAVPVSGDPLAELAHRVRALATCTDLSEVRAIRDVAVAAKEYARARELGEEAEGYAQEIINRAMRRIGQLLAETPKESGGDKYSTREDLSSPVQSTRNKTGYKLSAKSQQLAAIPEEVFEANKRLPTAGLLSIAKHTAAQRARKSERDARRIDLSDEFARGKGWQMFGGVFQERLLELPDGCLDAIVTDPPYPAESLPLWGDLAEHAARLLKPQGLLVALTGQILLPQVIEQVARSLAFGWVYVQPMPGQNSRIMGRHIFQTWKPWLVFSNGAWPSGSIDWHEDTTPESVAQKSYRWQQDGAPAAYLIEHLTTEGAVICDPFAGTGSYGEAVLGLGREFIGCEADAERFKQAVSRLEAFDGQG
jgi:16S rRNA G966 N2-methylase RsmD